MSKSTAKELLQFSGCWLGGDADEVYQQIRRIRGRCNNSMTKTTKQLIEEFPERPTFKDVCYEDFAQVIEALKEAEVVIRQIQSVVDNEMGKLLLKGWLKKNGFEE